MNLRLAFSFYFLITCTVTGAQSWIDTELKPDSRVYDAIQDDGFVYFSGATTNTCNSVPFVAKMALETGSTVWNTASFTDFSYQYARAFKHLAVTPDAVYAINDRWDYLGITPELWKINKTTGAIVWRKDIRGGYEVGMNRRRLMDYSSTQLLVVYGQSFFVVNKESGIVENTYTGKALLGVGNHQELFLPGTGGLVKVLNFDFANPVLVGSFSQACCCSAYSLERVEPLDDDNILVYGQRDCEGGTIWRVNHTSSQVLWEAHASGSSSSQIQEVKTQNGYLYASWKYNLVGGLTVSVRTSKVDLTSGEVIWISSKLYDHDYEGRQEIDHRGQGNTNSLTVDTNGDVYVTGYANSQDNFGDFGVMKISGANGDKLYEKIIATDSEYFDEFSAGIKAMVYNGRLFFLGNELEQYMEPFPLNNYYFYPSANLIALVELNPSSGDMIQQTNYKGAKTESSGVIQMRTMADGVLMLENRGRNVHLSKYGQGNQLVWEAILKHQYFYGHQALELAVDKEGNIAVLTTGIILGTNLDATTVESETGILFITDKHGEVVQKIPVTRPYYSDLYCDGSNFFALTSTGSDTNLYKADASGLVATKDIPLWLLPTALQSHRLAETSSNQLILTGEYVTSMFINKTTLEIEQTGIPFEPYTDNVNDIIVINDTAYVAIYSQRDNYSIYKSLCAYSLQTKSLIWSHSGSLYDGGYYSKMIRDSQNYLYAIGTGQYDGLLIRKINRKNGAIVWGKNWTYSTDIEPKDLFLDTLRNQLVITGSKLYMGKNTYVTVMLDAFTGGTVSFNQHTGIEGSGATIAQTQEGDIITGGYYKTTSANCYTNSIRKQYIPTRLSQSIQFNLTDTVDVRDPDFELTALATSGLPVYYESSPDSVASVLDNIVSIHRSGTFYISARQAGDQRYLPAAPVHRTLVIRKAGQVLSFPPLEAKRYGDSPFLVTVSSSSGLPVTLTSSDPNIVSVSNSMLTIHGAGQVEITATQDGDEDFLKAESVTRILSVSKADQTITFSAIGERTLNEGSFLLNAISDTGLPIEFTVDDSSVAALNGNEVTPLRAGETTITASQAGNAHYNWSETTQQLIISAVVVGTEKNEPLLSLYPNPTKDFIAIEGAYPLQSLEIINSLGIIENTRLANNNIVDLSDLSQGVYTMRVKCNSLLFSFRVVKY